VTRSSGRCAGPAAGLLDLGAGGRGGAAIFVTALESGRCGIVEARSGEAGFRSGGRAWRQARPPPRATPRSLHRDLGPVATARRSARAACSARSAAASNAVWSGSASSRARRASCRQPPPVANTRQDDSDTMPTLAAHVRCWGRRRGRGWGSSGVPGSGLHAQPRLA
jgi:hypothetical protein